MIKVNSNNNTKYCRRYNAIMDKDNTMPTRLGREQRNRGQKGMTDEILWLMDER